MKPRVKRKNRTLIKIISLGAPFHPPHIGIGEGHIRANLPGIYSQRHAWRSVKSLQQCIGVKAGKLMKHPGEIFWYWYGKSGHIYKITRFRSGVQIFSQIYGYKFGIGG